jgi:hypothetical protein
MELLKILVFLLEERPVEYLVFINLLFKKFVQEKRKVPEIKMVNDIDFHMKMLNAYLL